MILQNQFKFKLLHSLHRIFPFNITADWRSSPIPVKIEFSCLIPSCRPDHLKDILEDLSLQDFPKKNFEVIIVNDGPAEMIEGILTSFKKTLTITCLQNPSPKKVIGFLRNQCLEIAQGELILFLDDDTRVFQKDFLSKASVLFKNTQADILQPCANSLYGVISCKQDFLDHFSFATRCCLYTRATLERLGGFRGDLNSYSDIELGIRAMTLSTKVLQTEELSYYHPPLHFSSLQKPLAIGQSIFKLRQYYPFWVWLLIYGNALRFLPRGLWPTKPNQSWFMISFGVLLYPLKPQEYYHI